MRRLPLPALGRLEAGGEAHAPAEPGAGIGRLGPDVLVDPGKNHQVPMLQPRFKLPPDDDIVAPPLHTSNLDALHQGK